MAPHTPGAAGNPTPIRASGENRTVRWASSFDRAGLNERSWNRLARVGTHSVFQTYEWQSSWWSVYGPRYEPLLITVHDGATVSGLAPLLVDDTPSGRVVRFIGDGRADYCDLLAGHDADVVKSIVRGLKEYNDWSVVELNNVPSESRTAAHLAAACEAAGLYLMVDEHLVCPTVRIRGHEAAVQRLVNKPSLRRRVNYFGRLGQLGYRDLTAAAEIESHLDAFFEQHTLRWRWQGGQSLFSDPLNQLFYRELTQRMSRTDWLLFSLVELDDRPIAMHYGFDFDDAMLWYKPSFDPAFAAGSPGLVLLRHLISRALTAGRRELDFTIGDELFKRRFSNHARTTLQIRVFNDSARYYFERSKRQVWSAVRNAAGRMKRR